MAKLIWRILLMIGVGSYLFPGSISNVSARTVIQLQDSVEHYNLLRHKGAIYRDNSRQLTFSKLWQSRVQSSFSPLSLRHSALGYTNDALWLKFKVNDQSSASRKWYFTIGHPPLDHIKVYFPDTSGHYRVNKTGDRIPFHQRTIAHRQYVFSLPEGLDQYTFYVRITSESSVILNLNIWRQDAFLNHERRQQLGFGMYYGIIIIMFLYNLALLLALRDINYLYYILFIGGLGMFQFILSGLAFEYLWPSAPLINNLANPFFVGFAVFWGGNFCRKFLQIKYYHAVLNKIMWGIIGLAVLGMVAPFFTNNRISSQFVDYLVLIAVIVVSTSSFYVWYKNYKPARFFMLAWLGLLLAAALLAFESLGWIDRSFITQYGIYFGMVWLIISLSLALADRVNLMRKERLSAQQKAIKELEEKQKLKNKVNRELEAKVQQRTKEIEQQKALIEQKNQDLTDSINYAKRIQEAILPAYKLVMEVIPDSFILYKPRDIVSGDFYWLEQQGDKILLAAVDCTGHGVPGAFMSMVGNQILNKLVVEEKQEDPGAILKKLNQNIKRSLKQEHDESGTHDGMDIALCCIDKTRNQLAFAGAQRPLYLVRSGELKEWKGTPNGIGGYTPFEQNFKTHSISLESGDTIYIFSDGYPDQFGGEEKRRREKGGKKFMRSRFKQLLKDINEDSMTEQKQILNHRFNEWKGELAQVDDVLVMGVRI